MLQNGMGSSHTAMLPPRLRLSMKKLLRALMWIAVIFGAYVLLFGGYFLYSLSTAEGRVRPLCTQIKAGMSLAELEVFSSHNGLTTPRKTSDKNFAVLAEGRSYGRHSCIIIFDGDTVKSAEYSFLD